MQRKASLRDVPDSAVPFLEDGIALLHVPEDAAELPQLLHIEEQLPGLRCLRPGRKREAEAGSQQQGCQESV